MLDRVLSADYLLVKIKLQLLRITDIFTKMATAQKGAANTEDKYYEEYSIK